MIHTSCKKCVFAQESSSDMPCGFGIIDQIKHIKNISVKDNFFYIENYHCKYGLSKDTVKEYSQSFDDIDIKQYVLSQNTVKYYLIIDCRDTRQIHTMCKNINSLNILPQFVSIILYETDVVTVIEQIKKYLNPNITWKTHNFLNPDTSFGSAIKVALDTKHNLLSIPYLWFNSSTDLQSIIDYQAIDKINYIVNIEQPTCNFITSRQSTGIYNLFINSQTYYYLTKQHLSSIDKIIENIETTSVYYD